VNKFVASRPYADLAMRKILELANAFTPVQDGRVYIEAINGPMIFQGKATAAEYKAGLDLPIARGMLWLHESGTYVKSPRTVRSFSHEILRAMRQ
jgi:hypothetical protein